MKFKVAVGMSGGVDSSVSAALLKEQGYEVIGVFLRFWQDPTYQGDYKVTNKCCSVESMMDARRVANQLDIPFYVINVSEPFKEFVVDNFLEEYEQGRTPNPCVVCNQFVKLGLFLEKAKELGCDYIATGHYVRSEMIDGKLIVKKGIDERKDQSYFLYKVSADTLKNVLFPVGGMTKPEVRELARKYNLPVSEKQESQDISFIQDQDHADFLKRYIKFKSGNIVTTDGAVIGEHQGLPMFTIGQRKGIELNGGPWYVVEKRFKTNELVVTNDNNYPGLFSSELKLDKTNWLIDPEIGKDYSVRIRHQHVPAKCQISNDKDQIIIKLQDPQRAVTPGQSAVIYDGDIVVGGGIIQ